MTAKKKRTCRYCGKDISGTMRRVTCGAPKCEKRDKGRIRDNKRETTARHTRKLKIEKLRKNPIYCECCGNPLTEYDNLRYPICSKKWCKAWWENERPAREKERMKVANAKRASRQYHGKSPSKITYIPRPGDWNHKTYLKEQKAFAKPNGRGLCRSCGENVLTGNQMQRCKPCQERDNLRKDVQVDEYLFGGVTKHKHNMNMG
jgi:hypothetical protein